MIAQPYSRPPMLTVRNETVAADREVSLQITLGLSLGRPSGEDSPFLMVVPRRSWLRMPDVCGAMPLVATIGCRG